MKKIGRNDPCHCGSGLKHKKCCLLKNSPPVSSMVWQKIRRTEGELVDNLLPYFKKRSGSGAMLEAWDEFTLWRDIPFEPDTQPEFETVFLPWFLFNWIPDNSEQEELHHYPKMQIALHYLQQRKHQLDSFQRRFIEEACSRQFSFYMVSGVVPGVSLTLRDILLEKEVMVHERHASQSLETGDIVFTRVITMNQSSVMFGTAPTAIPPSYFNEIMDFREHLKARGNTMNDRLLFDYDFEIREIYYNIHEALHDPQLPEMQNTDGDELQPTKLYYKLEITALEAVEALATLALAKSADEVLHTGDFDSHDNLTSISFPWLIKGNKKHAGWDNTVMGEIKIDNDKLTIDVNSAERAEKMRRIIRRRLGKRATFNHASIQSMQQLMEEMKQQGTATAANTANAESDELMAQPEVQEHIRAMSEKHWDGWVDAPLPALKNLTPRDAAKTETGRERLNALLLDFAQKSDSTQPFGPDVKALRKTLGL